MPRINGHYWPPIWPQIFILVAWTFTASMTILTFFGGQYWLMLVNLSATALNSYSFWRLRKSKQELRATYKKCGIYVGRSWTGPPS